MKYLLLFLISFNVSASLYKLDIFNPDSSLYWTETFSSSEKLNKWLIEEKTRSYWNPIYTTTTSIINNDQAIPSISSLQQIKLDMNFGETVYANIRLMNVGKDKSVRDAMRLSFSTIRDALLDGDICSARIDIASITPDANISAQNIASVIGMMDLYKTCSN